MSTYAKLTKAELLEVIEQLETRLSEAKEFTFEGKFNQVAREIKLLGEDLYKLGRLVYELGKRTGDQVKPVLVGTQKLILSK